MAWIIPAVAAVGQIASSAAANKQVGDSRDSAKNAANSAIARLQEIGLPPDLSGPILLQQFKQAGILTPELEQHISAGVSQMGQVQGNAKAKDAQMSALQALQQRGKTGFTLQEQSEMNHALDQANRDQNAKQQQLVQQMQARGMGGSGAELAAALQESQSGANRSSQNALDVASQGQQRALQALSQGGQLGGQIEQQQFGEEAQKAQAQDAFNKLSYENQVAAQQRNVAAKNQAQQYNLGTQQQMANANTGQANNELLRQNQAQQQYWNSRLAQAGGQAAQDNTNSNFYSNLAGQQANAGAQTAAGVGQIINTVGNSFKGPSAQDNYYQSLANKNNAGLNPPEKFIDEEDKV